MNTTPNSVTTVSPDSHELKHNSSNVPWQRLERSPGSIEIIGPSPKVCQVLSSIGEDDPGVLLDWHFDAVSQAVQWANADQPPLPAWIPAVAYPITVEQLQLGISNTLAAAGGRQQLGLSLLAPNTDHQCNCIFVRAAYLMLADPFLAAICATPARHPIARLYLLGDGCEPMKGVHHPLPALPAGFGVKLFD